MKNYHCHPYQLHHNGLNISHTGVDVVNDTNEIKNIKIYTRSILPGPQTRLGPLNLATHAYVGVGNSHGSDVGDPGSAGDPRRGIPAVPAGEPVTGLIDIRVATYGYGGRVPTGYYRTLYANPSSPGRLRVSVTEIIREGEPHYNFAMF